MQKHFHLLLVLSVIFILPSCDKEDDLENYNYYNFETNFIVENELDSYTTNDTIWLNSSITNTLYDLNSESNISFLSAVMGVDFVVRSWTDLDLLKDNVEFVLKTPSDYLSSSDNTVLIGLLYNYDQTEYKVNFGVIFKEKGIYSMDFDYIEYLQNEINSTEYYGGGFVSFIDEYRSTQHGYLKGKFENNNMYLYNNLPAANKAKFQEVNINNKSQYYFIEIK